MHTEWEAGWSLEPVLILWEREGCLPPAGSVSSVVLLLVHMYQLSYAGIK